MKAQALDFGTENATNDCYTLLHIILIIAICSF